MADQFSLQFAIACKGWLLPILQCVLLDYKTNKQEKRQLRSTIVESWRYFWMFSHPLIPWIQCRRKINPMKSLQHIPLCDGVLGELLLCLICDGYPSGRHRNALWRGMVQWEGFCCILTAADLWAGNAVQQTAGEEHFPAVLQVRGGVLRLFWGQWGFQCAWF